MSVLLCDIEGIMVMGAGVGMAGADVLETAGLGLLLELWSGSGGGFGCEDVGKVVSRKVLACI
jgi:hypothetical protein